MRTVFIPTKNELIELLDAKVKTRIKHLESEITKLRLKLNDLEILTRGLTYEKRKI